MIVIWIGFCLLNCCFVTGFDEFFELKFPEMNAQLKKQQILFRQKMKNVLNSNSPPEKIKYNNSPYDDCVRLKNRTTIINDVEV